MHQNTYEEIAKAQKGDKRAMENLVKNNMGLVYSIAKRFSGRGYDIEDLNQIGAMGLVKSIKKFDTQYTVQLSTYSVPFIMGEIKRFLRDDGRVKVSRGIKELGTKIKELQNEQIRKNGKEYTIEELSQKLKIEKEDINLAMEVSNFNLVRSINEPAYEKDSNKETTIEELIPDKINQEKSIIDKLTVNKLIEELNEKERKIVILRYFQENTQTQVAQKLGISQVQVSRIEKRILNQMREKLMAI